MVRKVFTCVVIASLFWATSYRNDTPKLKLDIQIKHPSHTLSDGIIQVNVSGEKDEYTMIVNTNTKSNPITLKGKNFTLNNLAKGFYYITVFDADGNSASQRIDL
ncbi:MAG: hypothetical protein NZ529_04345 [Cytophagaceae bacterium]|nr:hypothetical protein [Cytophagaceae bacterium]MDW8456004.1 hypothetical protein [Cytophagaceae bacterium]